MSLLTSEAGVRSVPRCPLQDAAGGAETCPGARCPFWDDDGAGAGCAIERFVARVEWSPELAHFLLALRREFELARDGRADDAGWSREQRLGAE